MTVSPTTNLSLPRLRLIDLIAACPSFRSAVGETDSPGAASHVYSPWSNDRTYQDPAFPDDQTRVLLTQPRPRAIINHNDYKRNVIGTAFGGTIGSLILVFEFEADDADGGDQNLGLLRFEQQCGQIFDEMEARARQDKLDGEGVWTGQDTAHLNLGDYMIMEGPSACAPEENSGDEFFGLVAIVQYNG